jgi:DNA adenine methylase
MSRELPPIFCRVGSKSRIVKKILPLIPPHNTYVEPFVGSGAIYFAKQPSNKEYINDLDKELIQGYKLIKKVSTNIKDYNVPNFRKDSGYERNEKDPYNISLIQKFVNKKHKSNENKLLAFIYKVCNTFGAKGIGLIYNGNTQVIKLKRMEKYQERLKNTTILNKDYKDVIRKTDGVNTFYFLDPPYEDSKGLYKDFEFDYEELRDVLTNIKGKFMLTLNDSANIRRIFKQFKMKRIIVSKTTMKEGAFGSTDRKELIIMNY